MERSKPKRDNDYDSEEEDYDEEDTNMKDEEQSQVNIISYEPSMIESKEKLHLDLFMKTDEDVNLSCLSRTN